MKRIVRLSLISLGALAGSLAPTWAADSATVSTATTPAVTPPAAHAKAHPRAGAHRGKMRHKVVKRLGLTNDQITQLKATRASTASAVKAIRADAALTPEQKKAKIRETLQTARNQAKGVLTPDQQMKLQHLRARARRFDLGL